VEDFLVLSESVEVMTRGIRLSFALTKMMMLTPWDAAGRTKDPTPMSCQIRGVNKPLGSQDNFILQ
jgi:hypothetical protein